MMAIQEEIKTEPCALALRIGRNIRSIRKCREMTLAYVATKCGTSPQTISRLETAQMTISVEWLEKISDALGVAPENLFGADEIATEAVRANIKLLLNQLECLLEDLA